MQESELKLRFDDGVLTDVLAAPAPLHPKGWILIVTDRKKRQTVLQKQRGKERVFSSLDACFSTAKRIGFRAMSVAEQFRKCPHMDLSNDNKLPRIVSTVQRCTAIKTL